MNNDIKNFECDNCKKKFSTKGNLTKHMKDFCIFSKQNNLISDINLKYKELKKDYELLLQEKNKIEKDFEQNKNKLDNLYQENQDLKFKLVKIETENEIYKKTEEKQFNTISDIAKQPTISNSYNSYKNKLEIMFDLNDTQTIEDIQKKVNDGFEKQHFMNGQKGVAKVLIQEIFDNNGNKMYICSDYARGMFRFKDKYGNVHVDNKAMKLSDIVYNGVKNKLYTISRECMENEKDVDVIMSISQNVMDIKKMTEDNCDFRNEIINLSR